MVASPRRQYAPRPCGARDALMIFLGVYPHPVDAVTSQSAPRYVDLADAGQGRLSAGPSPATTSALTEPPAPTTGVLRS